MEPVVPGGTGFEGLAIVNSLPSVNIHVQRRSRRWGFSRLIWLRRFFLSLLFWLRGCLHLAYIKTRLSGYQALLENSNMRIFKEKVKRFIAVLRSLPFYGMLSLHTPPSTAKQAVIGWYHNALYIARSGLAWRSYSAFLGGSLGWRLSAALHKVSCLALLANCQRLLVQRDI